MPIEDFSLTDEQSRETDTIDKYTIGGPNSTITCAKGVETREIIITKGPMRPSIEGRRKSREVNRDNHPSQSTIAQQYVEHCNVIRRAAELVVELDTARICTDNCIKGPELRTPELLPGPQHPTKIHSYFRGPYLLPAKSCIRRTTRDPKKDHDYHELLREPLLWNPADDECYYYPIDTWTVIDAELDDEKEFLRDHYNGIPHTHAEAIAQFTNGRIDDTCSQYWRFQTDSHEDERFNPVPNVVAPRWQQPTNCDDTHDALETVESWLASDPNPDPDPPIIGVFIEYCCEEDSELGKEIYTQTQWDNTHCSSN